MKLFDKSSPPRNYALRIQYPYCFWDQEQPFFTLKIDSQTYRFINMMPVEKQAVLLTFIKQESNSADMNEVIDAIKAAIDEQLGFHYNLPSNETGVVGMIESLSLAKL